MPVLLNPFRFGGATTPDIETKRYFWSTTNDAATSVAVTIDAVTVANAWARPLGWQPWGVYIVGTVDKQKNFGCVTIVTGSTTVTVHLAANGDSTSRNGFIEVQEYVGPPGGANEFLVRHHAKEVLSSATDVTTLANTIGTLGDAVAIWSGTVMPAFLDNETFKTDRMTTRLEVTSTTQLTATRHDAGTNAEIGATVLEYTGSAWIIQKLNDTKVNPSTVDTHAITNVNSWAEAFIYATWEVNAGGTGDDDNMWLFYVGDSGVGQFKTFMDVSGATPQFTAYIVENPSLSVEHNDTIDGDAVTPATTARPDTTITAPVDHDLTTAVVGYAGSTQAGQQAASHSWGYELASATQFSTEYGDTADDEDVSYGFSIVDYDALQS